MKLQRSYKQKRKKKENIQQYNFYFPDQLKGTLASKLKSCLTFGLSSLKNDLDNDLIKEIKMKKYLEHDINQTYLMETYQEPEDRVTSLINDIVINLVVAKEYNLDDYLATFMAKEFHFISLSKTYGKVGQVDNKSSKSNMAIFLRSYSLPKEIAYELVKNSIKILFHEVDVKNLTFLDKHKQGYAEMISILNFFDNVFYDDNVIDISPKE